MPIWTERPIRFGCASLAAATAALAAWTSPAPALAASAAPVTLISATHDVRAGQSAYLEVRLSGAPESCRLQFIRSGRARKTTDWIRVEVTYFKWSWRVPGNARPARWTVRASCSRGSVQERLRIRSRGRGGRYAVAHDITTRSWGAMLGASNEGSGGGDQSSESGSGGDGSASRYCEPSAPYNRTPSGGAGAPPQDPCNPFPYGQCTYWAYEKRPDIYDHHLPSAISWDGGAWAENARAEGYPVDDNPQPGDIAVGYGTPGHVGYVESVDQNGDTVTVSSMDVNGNPEVQTFTYAAGDFDAYIHQLG